MLDGYKILLLEVAAAPSKHISARHFLHPDSLEVAVAPTNIFLRVTFCS